MRHDITMEGDYYRLRPVNIRDAAFIVMLRTSSQRNRFVHPISPDISEQEAWLERYFAREGDYYFVVEQKETGRPEGTISIYDLEMADRVAEWGRWALLPGSKGVVESALLIYRTAFDVLGLNELYCRTVIENAQVVLFHKNVGLVTRAKLPKHYNFSGIYNDAVEQVMTREMWERNKKVLKSRALWANVMQENWSPKA